LKQRKEANENTDTNDEKGDSDKTLTKEDQVNAIFDEVNQEKAMKKVTFSSRSAEPGTLDFFMHQNNVPRSENPTQQLQIIKQMLAMMETPEKAAGMCTKLYRDAKKLQSSLMPMMPLLGVRKGALIIMYEATFVPRPNLQHCKGTIQQGDLLVFDGNRKGHQDAPT
jgi:hypothetical protein